MFAILIGAALALAGAPAAETLPTGEWASRMIMSFTMDGELSGCRLENSGALKQPAAVEADCMDVARAETGGSGAVAPEATANLIFEERFVPWVASAASIADPPGAQLLSRQFVAVEIGADGKVRKCRPGEPTGSMPAVNENPCGLVAAGFDRSARNGEPLVGTMILSIYLRTEVIA
jgi:hypothetical protein